MLLTRRSKIKEVWKSPVGRDLLQNRLRQIGRSARWVESPLIANMTLQRFDRFAGPGFCDMLLEMATREPSRPRPMGQEGKVWWKEAVAYRIYLPSFMDSDHDGMGDLGGAIQRLPYLARLGADVLWLYPFLDGDSYGTRDWRKIREDLGDSEDLKELVRQAHTRDMRVVISLDIAYTSDAHPWFVEALEGKKEDYYIFRPGTPDAPPNNWTRGLQGAVWTWYPKKKAWGLHLGGRRRMDLNWDNAEVRGEMADVLRFWGETGVDGFDLGPVHMISKSSFEDGSPASLPATGYCGFAKFAYGPRMHRYLRELHAAVPQMLAGEARGVGTEMAKLMSGTGAEELDLLLDTDNLMPRMRGRGDDGQLSLLDIKNYYLYWMERFGNEHWMPLFLETRDTPRMVSRLSADPLYRPTLAKLLATLLLTLRGTPLLYQGQELGLPNTRFTSASELRDSVTLRQLADRKERQGEAEAMAWVQQNASDHAKTPMPWNAMANAGFSGAEPWMRLVDGAGYLNAAAQMEDGHSVWHHYQRLIALRQKNDCLIYGSFTPVFANNKKIFCYFRILEGHKWYVEMNLGERQVARPGRILASQKLMLSNYDTASRALRPYEANLYRCD